MTGNIAFNTGDNNFAYLYPTDDKSVVGINGGSSVYKGGFFRVYGIDEDETPAMTGGAGLFAVDGEKIVTTIQVRNDGKAYVNNNEIFTTAGGTFKGNIGFDTGDDNFAYLYPTDQKSAFGINASPDARHGGIVRVYGLDYKGNYSDTLAGSCLLQANDGENVVCVLNVRTDGKAYVNNNEIFTTAGGNINGGVTMGGNITFNTGSDNFACLFPADDKSVVGINGGSSVYKGGFFRVYGIDEEKNNVPGGVGLYACDGTKVVTNMQVRNDGKVYINDNEIVTSAGGTFTGNIKFNPSNKATLLLGNDSQNVIGIDSGNNYTQGGYIRLYGSDADNDNKGCVFIGASNGTEVKTSLKLMLDGTARINNKQILTTAGGNIEGNISMNGNIAFNTGSDNFAYLYPTDDKSEVGINGGSSVYKGGFLRVYGIDEDETPAMTGGSALYACDGEKIVTSMQVRNDGHAYVNGKKVICVESWRSSDGSSWYRKYSDGWIEQGGRVYAESLTNTSVTLPIAFTTTNYCPTFVVEQNTSTDFDRTDDTTVLINGTTKTAMTIFMYDSGTNSYATYVRWRACGY